MGKRDMDGFVDGLEEGGSGKVVERERSRGNFEKEDGERLERRGIGEEGGGERRFGGFEEVGELLEDGHLMDEFVDERDISLGGEADAGVERGGFEVV